MVLLGAASASAAPTCSTGPWRKWIGARDFDEVMPAFQEAGAAIAPIYDMEQLVNDPHVEATASRSPPSMTRTSGR